MLKKKKVFLATGLQWFLLQVICNLRYFPFQISNEKDRTDNMNWIFIVQMIQQYMTNFVSIFS